MLLNHIFIITTEIPRSIRKILSSDEFVLVKTRQSRWASFFTPDLILITNQRVILCSPELFGLRLEIKDFRYEDVANSIIKKGIFFANIELVPKFRRKPLKLENLVKRQIDDILKIIQENIKRYHAYDGSNSTKDRDGSINEDNPLAILKMRLARGEITREEFEETKKLIDQNN